MKKSKGQAVYALDVFIVILLVLSIVGAAVRVFWGNGRIIASADEEYYVSYVIYEAESSLGEYFSEGSVFYTGDGDVFGVVARDAVTTPAKFYAQNGEGEHVLAYSETKVDISGTFAVRGEMQEEGFVLSGEYLAPNMTVQVASGGVLCDILITDIAKAS